MVIFVFKNDNDQIMLKIGSKPAKSPDLYPKSQCCYQLKFTLKTHYEFDHTIFFNYFVFMFLRIRSIMFYKWL